MIMKKLVIFDLDGTLLDTVADLAAATNHALATLGFPIHPVDAYHQFVGRGILNLFRNALPERCKSEENVTRMRDLFVPYYNAHNTDATCPYPGIVSLLSELHHSGIALAVASNKYQTATEKLVKHFFPTIPFAVVLGQREGFPLKPDPAIVGLIAGQTGAEPDDVLYVGDSGVDMQTARNAGVESVGVTWGFRPVAELTAAGVWHLVNTAEEILHFVG